MQPPPKAGYDQASTMFSPEGRIYQVQYAQEAVRKGTIVAALRCSDGVVLLAVRREYSALVEPGSVEKIHQIDEHIGGATTGIISDGRVLVDIARREAQQYRFAYDAQIPVEELARQLGEYLTLYTQYGGIRPFGCALLMAGVDQDGPRVVEADPSGALYEYQAAVRGQGQQDAQEFLAAHHDPDRPLDACTLVGIQAVLAATAKAGTPIIEVATVSGTPPRYAALGVAQVEEMVRRAQSRMPAEADAGGA